LVKIPRNAMITRRIQKLRTEVKLDTQKLRNEAIQSLQELFAMAKSQATNPNLKPPQKQKWTRAAAYITQIMNTIAAALDNRQIDEDLQNLEKLVDEAAAKNKTQQAPAETS